MITLQKFCIPFLLLLFLAACGGGGGGSTAAGTGSSTDVSFAISDAPVDDAASVTVTIDSITFNRAGANDIRIDSFTSADLGIAEADTVTLDLLDIRGTQRKVVVDLIELEPGDYQNLRLGIIDEDTNFSFVEEISSGLRKPLKVPSDELKLGGFTVADQGVQSFVFEFDLRKAMTYNPGPDRYILKPRGVRVVAVDAAGTLQGNVDESLFDTIVQCSGKPDPEAGNVVYLYPGHDLDSNVLVDMALEDDAALPDNAVVPFAAAAVESSDTGYDYVFSYLPAGDYTLAFSCAASSDDPEVWDGLVIPLPATERVEVTLSAGELRECDLPLDNGQC